MGIKDNLNRAQIKLKYHSLKIIIRRNTSAKVDRSVRSEKEVITTNSSTI